MPKLTFTKPARGRNVQDHSYDKDTRTLTVTFHNGKRYQYSDVSPDLATGFRDSGGSGSYLFHHIAGNCPYQCLDGDHDHD